MTCKMCPLIENNFKKLAKLASKQLKIVKNDPKTKTKLPETHAMPFHQSYSMK